jgi:hypothetical protein
MHGADLREFLPIGLADVEHIGSAKTSNRSGNILSILFMTLQTATNDRSQNQDSFFALLHEPAEFVPRAEARNVACVGLLRSDEHHVVKTVAVESSNGLEIARKRLTMACVQRSDELFRGSVGDFLDLF